MRHTAAIDAGWRRTCAADGQGSSNLDVEPNNRWTATRRGDCSTGSASPAWIPSSVSPIDQPRRRGQAAICHRRLIHRTMSSQSTATPDGRSCHQPRATTVCAGMLPSSKCPRGDRNITRAARARAPVRATGWARIRYCESPERDAWRSPGTPTTATGWADSWRRRYWASRAVSAQVNRKSCQLRRRPR